jgi:hypothetical protein
MTKKEIKMLKTIAKTFPQSIHEVERGVLIKGRSLNVLNELTEHRFDYKANTTYVQEPSVKVRKLNHYKELKRFYKKYGPSQFLDKYTEWFINNHKEMSAKYAPKPEEQEQS